MIRINLLPKKHKTHIPFDLIIAVGLVLICVALVGVGWVMGQPIVEKMNDDLNAEIDKLDRDIKAKESKVAERDKKKKEFNKIKNEIVRLERLSGSNYVQWSKTLDRLKRIYPKDKVWITNLRIDSDRRVQISAYSCVKDDPKNNTSKNPSKGKLTEGIQEFIRQLLSDELFSEVFLTSASQNIYEKKPVWRFELNCRLLRDLNKSGD